MILQEKLIFLQQVVQILTLMNGKKVGFLLRREGKGISAEFMKQ